MKKWLIIVAAALTLSACSEPSKSVMEDTGMKATEPVKEQMNLQVHLYSLEQNTEGYVVRWDERDKWILTNASAVYQHPQVLVETSNGQLLPGTVVSMDSDNNVAIVHFRNSADVVMDDVTNDQIVIADEKVNQFMSFDADGESLQVSDTVLSNMIKKAGKKGLSFQKRTAYRAILESYPKRVVKEENKIDSYEKDTFRFDRDALEQYVYDFIEQYNHYVNQKENDLLTLILPDELTEVFTTWEVFGEKYTFYNAKVQSLQFNQFTYQASFNATMGKSDPQPVTVELSMVKVQDNYKITAFEVKK